MMIVRLLRLVETLSNKSKSDNDGDVACQIVQEQQNNVSQVTQNSGKKMMTKNKWLGDKSIQKSKY